MPLTYAQLMSPPGGAAVVGAVKAGTNVTISADGTLSASGGGGGGGDIPAGSVMVFYMSAAPAGWTRNTSLDNYALRLVSSGGGSTGGSVPFTTAFASQAVSGTVSTSGLSGSTTAAGSISLSGLSVSGSVGATTLTTQQLSVHSHVYYLVSGTTPVTSSGSTQVTLPGNNGSTGNAGQGNSHTHTFSGSVSGSGSFTGSPSQVTFSGSPSFSGNAINMAVQYADVLIATKN